jgi:hypothetical protein
VYARLHVHTDADRAAAELLMEEEEEGDRI